MRDAGDTPSEGLPRYLQLGPALHRFATTDETQGQAHIKPMHQHTAIRLVLEGGFLPDEVTPHPPLEYARRGGRHILEFAPDAETTSEKTIIGGLKTKDIDVVVSKPDIGPVMAISLKGTSKAFRNLTNRMEEAIGDCTNLHIMYPGLVYGFLAMIRANREGQPGVQRNDVSVGTDGLVTEAISRYHDILRGLAGRQFVRNEHTRYETVAMLLVESSAHAAGEVLASFPEPDSPLLAERFFPTAYRVYDMRYPYMATRLSAARRVEWSLESPALGDLREAFGEDVGASLGYSPRTAD